MEQRPLRLGDIVDDYCTRERRVTNHAIVALVENVIRQTRCTACDAEHAYRGAREPRLRKKPGTSELYDQVLADVTGGTGTAAAAVPARASAVPGEAPIAAAASSDASAPETDTAPVEPDGQEPVVEGGGAWLAHRRLIRATLPRTENEPPAPRPIPEFTMHQRPPARAGRGFRFRGHGGGFANGNGNGQSPNGFGHGGGRPGNSAHGRPGRHRGKKRR